MANSGGHDRAADGRMTDELAPRPKIEPPTSRVAYLDGWRGLSIGLVLLGHFIKPAGMSLGPIGVEFFFVLSGRLMAEILFVERFPLPRFYVRRVARIFPALIVFAVGCYLLVYKTELHFKAIGIPVAMAMVYNYFAALTGHHVLALDHIWSLCIEEHAYLILGMIALASRRWKLPVAPVLAVITVLSMADGIFSNVVLHQDWFTDYWRTDAHLGSIFGSAAIYLWSRTDGPLNFLRKIPYLPLLCGIAGWASCLAVVPIYLTYSVGTLLLAVSVCTLDNSAAWLRKLLSFRGLTAAGVLSYSIYLWQQPFYKLAEPRSAWAPALFLATVLVGAARFYLVERPARRLLNRLGDRALAIRRNPRAREPVASP